MKKSREAEGIQYKCEGQGFEVSIAQERGKGHSNQNHMPPKMNNFQKQVYLPVDLCGQFIHKWRNTFHN